MKNYCDGCLLSEYFTDEANEFLQAYYEKYYFHDLMDDCAYDIKDTWENYALLSELLDSRFAEWQETKSFKPEPALKTPKLFSLGKSTQSRRILFVIVIIMILFFVYLAAKMM